MGGGSTGHDNGVVMGLLVVEEELRRGMGLKEVLEVMALVATGRAGGEEGREEEVSGEEDNWREGEIGEK